MPLFDLLQTTPLLILPWVLAVLLSIGWHEFAHALAGYWQGDDTAQRQGRLTANPLAHIDWLGFALILLVGIGWGKPTPYNPHNLKFKKWGAVLVAFAGPISNMLMVLVAGLIFKLLGYNVIESFSGTSVNLLEVFLINMMTLNVSLALFNLVPIPPLDGSKLLFLALERRNPAAIRMLEQQGPFLLLIFLFVGQAPLHAVIQWVTTLVVLLFGLN